MGPLSSISVVDLMQLAAQQSGLQGEITNYKNELQGQASLLLKSGAAKISPKILGLLANPATLYVAIPVVLFAAGAAGWRRRYTRAIDAIAACRDDALFALLAPASGPVVNTALAETAVDDRCWRPKVPKAKDRKNGRVRVAYPPPIGPRREDVLPGAGAGGMLQPLAYAVLGRPLNGEEVLYLPWAGPYAISRDGWPTRLDALGFMPALWTMLLAAPPIFAEGVAQARRVASYSMRAANDPRTSALDRQAYRELIVLARAYLVAAQGS